MKPLIRILDDDPSIRASLKTVLEIAGYRAKAYADPQKFLDEDDVEAFGCLLLDVKMPGLTGYEVQKAMLKRAHLLPIIFISAWGDIPSVVETMKLGAVDFIQKPIDPVKLLDSIRIALVGAENLHVNQIQVEELYKRFLQLTDREKQILELGMKDLSSVEIGQRLGISRRTVENHKAMVYRKMSVRNRDEAKSIMKKILRLQKSLNSK